MEKSHAIEQWWSQLSWSEQVQLLALSEHDEMPPGVAGDLTRHGVRVPTAAVGAEVLHAQPDALVDFLHGIRTSN
ncbi:hypothetical protein [Kineococcus sp. SYSU DK005]|uniref:hypothetical protein n=1 Tax=Kineococcus sp. SYSU DK005 TaxID=3383126 RepID=UPI003D7C909D